MKITGKALRTAYFSLTKILRKEMDFKLAYRLKRIAKTIQSEVEIIEETRIGIVKKFGEGQKDNNYQIQPDKMEEFDKEVNEFLAVEIELDITSIPFEVIEKADIKLTPLDIVALEGFIEEPQEKKKNE